MCGLGGCFDLESERLPAPATAAAITAAIAPRGPDGQGIRIAPGGALVHTRLAIVGGESGAQPLAAGGGDVLAVVNGEIYNHAALRESLAAAGARFAGGCDCEVVPHAWALGGLDGLAGLDGEFALAVWDRRAGRLALVCDRFRTKPLFWTVRDGWLFFASDVRALLAAGGSGGRPELDGAALRSYLAWGCVPGGAPPLKGIRTLAPGQAAVFARGRAEPELRRLFPLDAPASGREAAAPPPATPEALRQRLLAAVKARLQGDRLPGVWLSGGLDSGLLAVLAQRAAGREVEAFTLGVDGPGYDERRLARLSAAAAGVRHHEAVLSLRSLAGLLPAFEASDVPLADTAVHTAHALARLTSAVSRAALSGEGADELFGGYHEYRALRLAGLVPRPLLHAAAFAARWLPGGDGRFAPRGTLSRFCAGALDRSAPGAWPWRRCMSGADIEAVFVPGALGPRTEAPSPAAGADPGATDLATLLPDMLLVKADRMGLANRVEVRLPYLDGGVAALARAAGFAPGKRLLRAAARGLVPDEVLAGRKRGFSAPVRAWLRSDSARTEVHEFLLSGGSKLHDRLRPETVSRWLVEHSVRRTDRSREIHALLALEGWMRGVG